MLVSLCGFVVCMVFCGCFLVCLCCRAGVVLLWFLFVFICGFALGFEFGGCVWLAGCLGCCCDSVFCGFLFTWLLHVLLLVWVLI